MKTVGHHMPPLKISCFGSSLVSAYWNGAATYYRGLIRALHDRGHQITFYEPDAYDRQKHRDIPDPDWAADVVYPNDESAALAMVERARGSDLIIKCSGVGVFDALLERAVLDLQTSRTMVAFMDVDAPATLDRVQGNPADPFGALIPRYDMIFTYGGGEPVISAYKALDARDCVPIYNALDPQTHFVVPPESRFKGELGFLGNRLPDREKRVEEFFLDVAAQMPDHTFLLGGSGWQDKPMSSNVRYLGHVYTHEHNAFNCTPKAVLNVARDSMARYGFSPATRVFEAAGSAACVITDYWEGIETFFEPGNEILVARNGLEVCDILQRLATEEARAIGRAAYRRVMSEHTYAHRAEQMERVIEGAVQPGEVVA